MKSIALMICTFSSSFALATQAYSGFVNRLNDTYFFQVKGVRTIYRIAAAEVEVAQTLKRLNAGDFINASGTVDPAGKVFVLESIDFVGLSRLLGPWISSEGSLVFENFNTLTMKPMRGPGTQFHYSITPGDDDEWAIFLSDSNKTIIASLKLDPSAQINGKSTLKKFLMKFFEEDTSTVLQTITLERP